MAEHGRFRNHSGERVENKLKTIKLRLGRFRRSELQ
jgi:hypothetical protein